MLKYMNKEIQELEQRQRELKSMLEEVERKKQEILIQLIEIQGVVKYIKSKEIKVETK
jgi:hypothetical protein